MKASFSLSVLLSLLTLLFFASCQKEVDFQQIQAQYSFVGGTSSCTDANISGTYQVGTPANLDNKVVLTVTVDSVGAYAISTNTVNGISFSGTGSFTSEGTQTITLTASGTPAAAGSFDFSPGSTACSFNVIVNSSGGGPIAGSDNFLRCKIDGVLSNFNTSLIGYNLPPPATGIPYSLSVQGKNSDVAGSPIELSVALTNTANVNTGVYTNRTISMDMNARACQVSWFPTGFPNPYWAASVIYDNTLTVTLSSVSSSGASGTFAGTIYDINGGGMLTKEVTDGEFKISF